MRSAFPDIPARIPQRVSARSLRKQRQHDAENPAGAGERPKPHWSRIGEAGHIAVLKRGYSVSCIRDTTGPARVRFSRLWRRGVTSAMAPRICIQCALPIPPYGLSRLSPRVRWRRRIRPEKGRRSPKVPSARRSSAHRWVRCGAAWNRDGGSSGRKGSIWCAVREFSRRLALQFASLWTLALHGHHTLSPPQQNGSMTMKMASAPPLAP
jgi:hypothetical protein